mmetsp:Transcript_172522/g.553082  ORF Transcript_172522/g.553082 Transcript_172522/m.553082 type:complete len:220 (-) Transcript_172522:268-927(-)
MKQKLPLPIQGVLDPSHGSRDIRPALDDDPRVRPIPHHGTEGQEDLLELAGEHVKLRQLLCRTDKDNAVLRRTLPGPFCDAGVDELHRPVDVLLRAGHEDLRIHRELRVQHEDISTALLLQVLKLHAASPDDVVHVFDLDLHALHQPAGDVAVPLHEGRGPRVACHPQVAASRLHCERSVVLTTLGLIRQHLVGLGDALESRHRERVVRVLVGVVEPAL